MAYTLFTQISGQGIPILFLHGLGGSYRKWDRLLPLLPQTYQYIAVDLLGFGKSPKPNIAYTLDEHIKALSFTLQTNNIEPQIIIAHSLGVIIACEYAKRYPKHIKKLILISPPIFKTPHEAKERILASFPRAEYLLYSPLGRLYCGIHSLFHPFFFAILPLFFRKYPKAVIQDFLLHTWQSYKYTVTNVIEQQQSVETLKQITIPTLLLYADDDVLVNENTLQEIAESNKYIRLKKRDGQHDLPLLYPQKIKEEIEAFL